MTQGQRVALQQVENVKAEQRDGTIYWTYEHLSQASYDTATLHLSTTESYDDTSDYRID